MTGGGAYNYYRMKLQHGNSHLSLQKGYKGSYKYKNVVIFLIDQPRTDEMSANLMPKQQTPDLKELAVDIYGQM